MMKFRTNEKRLILGLMIFTFASFLAFYEGGVNSYNATILALNYSYGFVSRGLMGTVYALLDVILPFDLMNYQAVLLFCQIATGIFFLFLIAFSFLLFRRVESDLESGMGLLVAYLFMLLIPSFSCLANFGRVDIYLIMVSLLAVLLLVYEKAEFLVAPLAFLGVCIHQGYVFMYLNLILVLLLYKILSKDGKKRGYYMAIFLVTFLGASALFLYFEFVSHGMGEAVYDEIVSVAEALSLGGEYHEDLLLHEVLGVDLSEKEWNYHKRNFVELGFFILLFLPYILAAFQCMKGIFREVTDRVERIRYFFVAAGGLTMLPNFILKCDYGRWIIAVIVYYLVISMALLAMGDETIAFRVRCMKAWFSRLDGLACLMVAYPMLFMPMWDVNLGPLISTLSHYFNQYIWQLWP